MAACYPFQWGFSSGIYDAEIHAGIQLLSMLLVEKTFHFFFFLLLLLLLLLWILTVAFRQGKYGFCLGWQRLPFQSIGGATIDTWRAIETTGRKYVCEEEESQPN